MAFNEISKKLEELNQQTEKTIALFNDILSKKELIIQNLKKVIEKQENIIAIYKNIKITADILVDYTGYIHSCITNNTMPKTYNQWFEETY